MPRHNAQSVLPAKNDKAAPARGCLFPGRNGKCATCCNSMLRNPRIWKSGWDTDEIAAVPQTVLGVYTDGEGNVKGIISVGDIARSFMASSDSGVLSAASTPVKNVVETIGAQLVCGNPDAVINSGRVMIASTEADLDRCSVSGGDTVLLVDDEKAQKKAVINGAACIIVCLGADPATKIIIKITTL